MDTQSLLTFFIGIVLGLFFTIAFGIGFFKVFTLWMRHKHREKISVTSVLLQVSLPRDNEIKIDADGKLMSLVCTEESGNKTTYKGGISELKTFKQ